MADTPLRRVAVLVALIGAEAVADSCAALLRGADPTDPSVPALAWFGGSSEVSRVAKGLDLGDWPRVWAARGLLHCYRPVAAPAVVDGLADESWRVREMCAKVVRAHEIGSAAAALHRCCSDDVTRVRVAAVRGLATVGESEDAKPIRDRLDDEDPTVVAAAETALRDLSRRLDHDV